MSGVTNMRGKIIIILAILSALLITLPIRTAQSRELSKDYQTDLIERVLYLRNMEPIPTSLSLQSPERCGTSIALEYFINRDSLTLKSETAEAAYTRPALAHHYQSAGGHFWIHYDTDGLNAVYLPTVDTLHGGDGIPDYVNKVAEIADSVWDFEINHLGYPEVYDLTGGGDELMDIYILDLGVGYYGVTYPESTLSAQAATSFIAIDNNFNFWPYNLSSELNRRLDAARVTVAHEFFHTIHFMLDYTEYEMEDDHIKLYWWEMSATWMEEMMYDDIDDYYGYLEYYFDYTWLGLQCVDLSQTLHQYASMLFPLFLTEKFDTSIVYDIWDRCQFYGTGSQFPLAANSAIIEISGGDYDLLSAFNEFAAWNYLTAAYAGEAPDEMGYSEAGYYPAIPDSVILDIYEYDDLLLIWPMWPDTLSDGSSLNFFKLHMPQNMSAHYIRMNNPDQFRDTLLIGGEATIDWAVIIMGYNPNTHQYELLVQTSIAGGDVLRFVKPSFEYDHFVMVISPVSTSIDLYPDQFGYNMAVRTSTDVTDYPENDILPEQFQLDQNYPNPFNPLTTIAYSLPSRSDVKLTVYNVLGQAVTTLVNGYRAAGNYTIMWDGTDQTGRPVPSGIYFYQLSCGDFQMARKMILSK